MKHCSMCKEEKATDQFNKKRITKDGLQTHCRECSHKKFAAYYYSNQELHLANVKANKKEALKIARQYIMDYFTDHHCVDCGESDKVVLEFDHVKGKKRKEVSKLVTSGCGLPVIKAEIEKCEVRCCNCHRRKTYLSCNSYRTRV